MNNQASTGTTTVDDNVMGGKVDPKAQPPVKPCSIQIARVDNGWLVGVHHSPQHRDYGCGPAKQYVFRSARELARGIEQLSEGHEPHWMHEAWLELRRAQFDDLERTVRKFPQVFNASVGDDVVSALVHFVNRAVQNFKPKKK